MQGAEDWIPAHSAKAERDRLQARVRELELEQLLRARVREMEAERDALKARDWTPKDGVWIVQRDGQSKQWIGELAEGLDLAPYAAQREAMATVIGRVLSRPSYAPLDIADALTRWMRDDARERLDAAKERDRVLELQRALDKTVTQLGRSENKRNQAEARVREMEASYVDLQRHRDQWRRYAYGRGEKPTDFLDGNMAAVDRGPTKIEQLEARVQELEAEVSRPAEGREDLYW